MNQVLEILHENKELAVLSLLLETRGPVGPRDAARTKGLSPRGGKIILERLLERGLAHRVSNGQFRVSLGDHEEDSLRKLMEISRSAVLREREKELKDAGRKIMRWNEEVRDALGNARRSLRRGRDV